MKNKLIDLNDHLFLQLERVSDDDLTSDEMEKEINRSKAVSSLASQIISGAKLALQAQSQVQEFLIKNPPKMLGVEGYEEED